MLFGMKHGLGLPDGFVVVGRTPPILVIQVNELETSELGYMIVKVPSHSQLI